MKTLKTFWFNEAPPPGGGGIFNCFPPWREAFNLKSDEAISATKHGGLSCFAYIPRQETEVFAKADKKLITTFKKLPKRMKKTEYLDYQEAKSRCEDPADEIISADEMWKRLDT